MNKRITAIAIHVTAWTLLCLVPFFSTYQVLRSISPVTENKLFLPVLILGLSLIVIFYLNYFWLIKKYLLKKKYVTYAVSFIACTLLSIAISGLIFYVFDFRPELLADRNPLIRTIGPIARANAFLMLVVAFVTSISLSLNDQLRQTEKEKGAAEVALLKSQINPHFLFNTLNSIYATAIDSSPQTAEMVEKLSEMMRYTMRDTQKDFVLLEDEISYISNYVELQRLRLDTSVALELIVRGGPSRQLQIAPMLLIPFIENAFKHGVNPEQKSDICIDIEVQEKGIRMLVANTKVHVQDEMSELSGLGIENTKSRLQLIYPSAHTLTINQSENDFKVVLHINLL